MSTGVAHVLMHIPKRRKPVPALPFGRTKSALVLALSTVIGPTLCGCSMTFPMGSLMPADETTGSNSTVPFGRMLDEEDRRREKAALATALDPQGDGSTVHWENVKSRSKGAITAVGPAYPHDGKVCRAFLGDFQREAIQRAIQGTACTLAAGEWAVSDAKPFAKS